MAEQHIALPLSIISGIDLARVERELEGLDDFLVQARVRSPGAPMTLPRVGRLLEELATTNNVNLLDKDSRTDLRKNLRNLRTQAPSIHISFAADPPASFLQKIIQWLRREIHPQLLLQIGLQPGIAAGCIVRTPNRLFDFSLRRHFMGDRRVLIDQIIKAKDEPDQ